MVSLNPSFTMVLTRKLSIVLALANVFAVVSATKYVICDNDWSGSASFIPPLIYLNAGYEILGLTTSIGNTFVEQQALHALRFLEIGNLTSIPVVLGAELPLRNTYERMQLWEQLYGKLAWSGAFNMENLTAEALGSDPSGPNVTRTVPAAIPEGLPTTLPLQGIDAPNFMIEMVHKYPGQVDIYAAGAMTNIALAIKLNSTFASMCKSIVIQGGYLDVNLLQVTIDMDIFMDFNIFFDPEAASIMFQADFPNITVVGDVLNYNTVNQTYLDEIAEVDTPYTRLMHEYYGTLFPLWDESAAAVQAYPELATEIIVGNMDVDTAYDGPSYGMSHVWPAAYAPDYTRPVSIVRAMDKNKLYDLVKTVVQKSY